MATSDSRLSIPLCLTGPGLWSSCPKTGKCGPKGNLCVSNAVTDRFSWNSKLLDRNLFLMIVVEIIYDLQVLEP